MKTQVIPTKLIGVKMEGRLTLSGDKYILLRCSAKGCQINCGLSLRIPGEYSSVKDEALADVFSSHCARLGKVLADARKQDGPINLTSYVKREAR